MAGGAHLCIFGLCAACRSQAPVFCRSDDFPSGVGRGPGTRTGEKTADASDCVGLSDRMERILLLLYEYAVSCHIYGCACGLPESEGRLCRFCQRFGGRRGSGRVCVCDRDSDGSGAFPPDDCCLCIQCEKRSIGLPLWFFRRSSFCSLENGKDI